MASISSKNALQEYYQKRSLPLPRYTTIQISQTPIRWKSTVLLHDGKKFQGNVESSKSAAELSAAGTALYLDLQPLDNNKKVVKSPTTSTVKNTTAVKLALDTVIIIDVENMPKILNEVVPLLAIYTNLYVYAFVGEHHPQHDITINTQKNILDDDRRSRVTVVSSKSTRPDGSDTCIQLYVGAFLFDETYDAYLICTIDHFGGGMVDLISATDMLWPKKQACVVTKLDHIKKQLLDIGIADDI